MEICLHYTIKGILFLQTLNHTLVVKKDRTLWAWGSNYGGALGDGTEKDSVTPVKILDDVTSVAAGTCHSLAIKKDGSLWSWGQGLSGFSGSKGYNLTPEMILEDVVSVCANEHTNYALKTDGTLLTWGDLINLNSLYAASLPQEALADVWIPGVAASRFSSGITVNGKAISLEAYIINDYSYLKLRDIAAALNGTEKQLCKPARFCRSA